jgi:hypothetical protein
LETKGKILVLGIMGRTPVAGVAWQVLHYLEGLRRLGYEPYYVEDTGDWPFDPEQNTVTEDCRYAVSFIARLMEWLGLDDRWTYRAASQGGRSFGLGESDVKRLVREADALINVTGATVLRDEHLQVPVRIFLESDPVLPQIEIARGEEFTLQLLGAHTHHFTFGENVGSAECPVPVGPFAYRPTRQPVVVDWWNTPGAGGAAESNRGAFTTISTWLQSGKDVEWRGETYLWSKHVEFLKFADLPHRTTQPLELALAGGSATAESFLQTVRFLSSHGWHVADGLKLSKDIFVYRKYIQGSRGEFTVAKDQYVRMRTGWFSDRSACYLAAGRPVVTQDTAFDRTLPTGHGLFSFTSLNDVLQAIDAINSDYDAHCTAAREIAREFFAAERVVAQLMAGAGL